MVQLSKSGVIDLDHSEDAKHDVLRQLDEQAEGEPSEDVVDLDNELAKAGLRTDPDDTLKELNAQQDLKADEKEE